MLLSKRLTNTIETEKIPDDYTKKNDVKKKERKKTKQTQVNLRISD